MSDRDTNSLQLCALFCCVAFVARKAITFASFCGIFWVVWCFVGRCCFEGMLSKAIKRLPAHGRPIFHPRSRTKPGYGLDFHI
ncbi:hypothetical protein BDR06DRAFT_734899 [Suillus hirtellus]|nr:hypothetical protein BDR06DRAFT_734899 [Suillus hirtellus]